MKPAPTRWLWIIPALVLGSAVGAAAQVVECTPHSYPQRTNQSLAVDPYDDRIVYVGVEGEGYFKTRDAGATWSRSVNGIRAMEKLRAMAPERLHSRKLRSFAEPAFQ